MNFYALIIGTEILNGRREDKHFEFVKKELSKYGHELFASLIIKDDKELITKCFEMIQSDEQSILFSFGGIGSTPDDLTREIAAKVFTRNNTVPHKKFLLDIIDKFGDEAYPYRIHMADLPSGADLLFNPINNMSGFSLQNRYFFVPGFPSMSHPMISTVIKTHFSFEKKRYRKTLIAHTSENSLISIMEQIPQSVELSSLPMFIDSKPQVELSLIGDKENDVEHYFALFVDEINKKKIYYTLT